jgi:hypothetical protein
VNDTIGRGKGRAAGGWIVGVEGTDAVEGLAVAIGEDARTRRFVAGLSE